MMTSTPCGKGGKERNAVHPRSILLLLLLLLVSCGGGGATTQPAAQQTPATEATTPLPADQHTPTPDASQTMTDTLNLSGLTPVSEGQTLHVVATTSLVGDVVGIIGGATINLTVLMPPGTDPHTFEPTPRDLATLSEADVIFINGVGLESFLEPMLQSSSINQDRIISVSHGVTALALDHDHAEEHADEGDHSAEGEEEHDHGEFDPHVWFSPLNVVSWADTIEQTLAHADPAHASEYATRAAAYRQELHDLDTWIREQVAQIPEQNRKLVTDHEAFGYFAHEYGFEQVGAVIPGASTLAEPTAKELADLEDAIREQGVSAIFVGSTVNPDLSERVAQDTGTKLVPLYTGSLSEKGGPADTYLKMMQYDTQAIVAALATP